MLEIINDSLCFCRALQDKTGRQMAGSDIDASIKTRLMNRGDKINRRQRSRFESMGDCRRIVGLKVSVDPLINFSR